MNQNDMKLLTAIIVVIALAMPLLKEKISNAKGGVTGMLDVKDIRKTFNKGTVNEKKALQGLNLHLNDGDFVTVIGGNGAGKSTMLSHCRCMGCRQRHHIH